MEGVHYFNCHFLYSQFIILKWLRNGTISKKIYAKRILEYLRFRRKLASFSQPMSDDRPFAALTLSGTCLTEKKRVYLRLKGQFNEVSK